MSYRQGQIDALMKLGYDLDDASRVLQLAKQRKLPKASRRLIPEIGTGYAHAKPDALSTYGITGKENIKDVAKAHMNFGEAVGMPPEALAQVRDQYDPHSPLFAPRKALTNQYKEKSVIVPGSSDPRKYMGAKDRRTNVRNHPMTGDQHKMLHSVLDGHEMDEAAVRAQMAMQPLGHNSSDVVLREHNRLATMPQGFEPVRNLMQEARNQMGEASALADYGIQYGEGPRLSRHARKRIAQRIEQDSALQTKDYMRRQQAAQTLLDDADPGIRFEDDL